MTEIKQACSPCVDPLADLSRSQAAARADAIACSSKGRSLSYGELDARANQVAQGLLAQGCRDSARIAVLVRNSTVFIEILLGTLKARGVLLPLNWRLAAPEILHILGHGEAEVLFVERDFLGVAEQAAKTLARPPRIIIIDESGANCSFAIWRDKQSAVDPALTTRMADVALQLYTSGTTGLPKGVQLTNRNYTCSLETALQLEWQRIAPGQTIFAPAPFFHLNGINPVIRSMHAGARLLTIDQFRPSEVMEMFVREKVNRATLAPAMIQICLEVPGIETMDFSNLELITYGGSPISQRVLARAKEVFGCEFGQAYGMTESSGAVTYLGPADHAEGRNKLLSCGRPLNGVEVQVFNPSNAPCAVREVGEVVIRGPMVTKGYWNDEKATANTIVDGWLRTGDAAYFDEDGYLYIYDRVKEMIVSGGENVYPAEVENALFHHSDVADVAVIGVPDEKWGEAVKALVVLKPGASLSTAALIDHARAHIGGYKIPKSVEFVAHIPRNAAGKILRKELREPYWKNQERKVN